MPRPEFAFNPRAADVSNVDFSTYGQPGGTSQARFFKMDEYSGQPELTEADREAARRGGGGAAAAGAAAAGAGAAYGIDEAVSDAASVAGGAETAASLAGGGGSAAAGGAEAANAVSGVAGAGETGSGGITAGSLGPGGVGPDAGVSASNAVSGVPGSSSGGISGSSVTGGASGAGLGGGGAGTTTLGGANTAAAGSAGSGGGISGASVTGGAGGAGLGGAGGAGMTTLGGANTVAGAGGGISGASVTGGSAGAGLGGGSGAGGAAGGGAAGGLSTGAALGLGGPAAALGAGVLYGIYEGVTSPREPTGSLQYKGGKWQVGAVDPGDSDRDMVQSQLEALANYHNERGTEAPEEGYETGPILGFGTDNLRVSAAPGRGPDWSGKRKQDAGDAASIRVGKSDNARVVGAEQDATKTLTPTLGGMHEERGTKSQFDQATKTGTLNSFYAAGGADRRTGGALGGVRYVSGGRGSRGGWVNTRRK